MDGPGTLLVERYGGCYQNVLGLPMVRLDRLLRELGYSLFEIMDGPKAVGELAGLEIPEEELGSEALSLSPRAAARA